MSRYTDTKAAIVAAIKDADPTCPNVWDRFRDPKIKLPENFNAIFQVKPTDGSLPYIHGWHFDKRSKTNGALYASQGLGLDSVSTSDETWEIEALKSFVDDGPNISTYVWQEVMDGFEDKVFNSLDIQKLEHGHNLVLKTVSIADLGWKYLYGETKCHVASITLAFQIIY